MGFVADDFILVQVPSPHPASIYIREQALVVNLESIRMIICKDQVFLLSVPNPTDPHQPVFPSVDNAFVADLVDSLSFHAPAPGPR